MTAIRNKWARVLRALALVFCPSLLLGCATLDDFDDDLPSALNRDADYAIYIARIDRMKFVGELPCPKDHFCLSAYFDLKLTPLEFVAGNTSIGTQTYSVAQHVRYADGVILLVHAQRDEDGEWQLIDRNVVELGACLGSIASNDAATIRNTDSEWRVETSDDGMCLSKLYKLQDY